MAMVNLEKVTTFNLFKFAKEKELFYLVLSVTIIIGSAFMVF